MMHKKVTRQSNALTSISDSLAAMFLKKSLEKGHGLKIPSLGIEIKSVKTKKRDQKEVK